VSFSADVKRFSDKARIAAERIVRETEIDLYSAVIMQTPVKEGLARGNWFFESGAESTRITDSTDKDGGRTVAAMKSDASAALFPRKAYLTNNLPYAIPLEEGHSANAPAGMVRINAKRAAALLRAKVREHKV